MIEVNLLPGSGGKSQSRADFNVSGMISGAASGIKDKFLLGSVGTVAAVVVAVALMFMSQTNR